MQGQDGKNARSIWNIYITSGGSNIGILYKGARSGSPNSLTLTHFCREFKKWSDFHETSHTLPKGGGKNIHEFFFVSSSF